MRRLFFALVLLIPVLLSAQAKQFEGEIHYLHLFHFNDSTKPKPPGLIEFFGSSSNYYYKNGSYKWTFEGSDMQVEYHNGETGITYDKYKRSDTAFYSAKDRYTDTIIRYKIFPNTDTICGYVCDRLTILTGREDDEQSFLLRHIYFSRELPLDPSKFKDFKAFCTNEVYKITASLPLRIEMTTPAWPFTMRFEAIKVVKRELSEKEVALPRGSITASR